MANSKWIKQKESTSRTKLKNCQPRRKTPEVVRTFQESSGRHSWNHWKTYKKKKKKKKRKKKSTYQIGTVYAKRAWAAGLKGIHPEEWKTRKFDDILLRLCDSEYKQNTIWKWTKGTIYQPLRSGRIWHKVNF